MVAQKENPGQQVVTMPDMLAVGADYGLTVMAGSSAAAQRLAEFIVSPAGQKILVSYGFASGTQR
jgi:ABC-type molybdate transport system substrate-binding protein